MHPDILYAKRRKGNLEFVEDWDTYYALRKKYAIDERSLYGEIILDISRANEKRFKEELRHIPSLKDLPLRFTEQETPRDGKVPVVIIDSGEYAGECLFSESRMFKVNKGFSRFFIDKASEQIMELFDVDVREFSEVGGEVFGHILAKHGIIDPRKWFEERLKQRSSDSSIPPYSYDPKKSGGGCSLIRISFGSFFYANDKFVRAHEMGHRITADYGTKAYDGRQFEVGRSGLGVFEVKEKIDKKTKEVHYIGNENGRALDEGVTNLIACKLLGIDFSKSKCYKIETLVARRIAKRVGIDTVFEAAFFDPQILADKWREVTKSEHAYARMVHALDNYQELIKKLYGVRRRFINTFKYLPKRIARLFKPKPTLAPPRLEGFPELAGLGAAIEQQVQRESIRHIPKNERPHIDHSDKQQGNLPRDLL